MRKMALVSLVAFLVFAIAGCSTDAGSEEPTEPTKAPEPNRFIGTWECESSIKGKFSIITISNDSEWIFRNNVYNYTITGTYTYTADNINFIGKVKWDTGTSPGHYLNYDQLVAYSFSNKYTQLFLREETPPTQYLGKVFGGETYNKQ
jgi:hypothetical protein